MNLLQQFEHAVPFKSFDMFDKEIEGFPLGKLRSEESPSGTQCKIEN